MTLLIAILIGATAGLMGALLGVGGGIIMVPAFIALLKLEPKVAIATSMAVIVVTAASATLNNAFAKPPLIDWKIALATGVAAIIAAWFGADLMRSLSNDVLKKSFAVLLILVGVRTLLAT